MHPEGVCGDGSSQPSVARHCVVPFLLGHHALWGVQTGAIFISFLREVDTAYLWLSLGKMGMVCPPQDTASVGSTTEATPGLPPPAAPRGFSREAAAQPWACGFRGQMNWSPGRGLLGTHRPLGTPLGGSHWEGVACTQAS